MSTIKFHRYSERDILQDNIDLGVLDKWLLEFICQPHAELIKAGRTSAVCPLALPAIQDDHLLIAHLELNNKEHYDKRQYLANKILNIASVFKQSTSNAENSLDCLIIALSGVEQHEWRYVVDGAYADVKPSVLEKKMMVGSFHPLRNRPSRITNLLFPLRSPIPLVAIRHMIRSDWRTLVESETFLSIYRRFYDFIDEK